MNCAAKMEEVISNLQNPDLYDLIPECKDEWTQDYAIILLSLMEEDYRDYDKIKEDFLDEVRDLLDVEVEVIRGNTNRIPKSDYVMHAHPLRLGFEIEIELYNAHRMSNGY